jgi:hypothetical protein
MRISPAETSTNALVLVVVEELISVFPHALQLPDPTIAPVSELLNFISQ